MYLETMERVFGGMDKIIVDAKDGAQSVVPYLPLNELTPSAPKAGTPRSNSTSSGGQQ
jgi:membrane protease subunit HflK